MKVYEIDFVGTCEIEAESFAEARKKLWEIINEDEPLPNNLYEITDIIQI